MGIDITQLSYAAQRQIAAKLAQQEREKAEREEAKRKFHNTPDIRQVSDTKIRFDSKAEAARYDQLVLLARAGRISDLRLQPQYTLQEAYKTPEGKRIRAIRYVADFSYVDDKDKLHVEDVKSKATKTRVYAIKKKLLRDKYGIDIEEIE